MDAAFRELIEGLHPTFVRLVSMPPVRYRQLPRIVPVRGIYLFSEGKRHLYVGRTNRIRGRLRDHCRPGGTHFTATFAFRIARTDTGMTAPSYTAAGSRAALLEDPVFAKAFEAAKERVAAMDIRFVEETDPVRQALLELYAATVLQTPYNEFDNH